MEHAVKQRDRLLELKPSKAIKVADKRPVQAFDPTVLRDGQREAYEGLSEWFKGEGKFASLTGYAGTGKTFTLTGLVENLLVENVVPIAISAPSNKAVKVLYNMSAFKSGMVKYLTVHKLLGLKMKRTQHGDMYFEPDKSREGEGHRNTLGHYRLIIVDEASMLEDRLYDFLEELSHKTTKIIFTGDIAQIPPVKNDISRAMIEDMPSWNLSEIVRQAHDNPILAEASFIRENLKDTLGLDYDEDEFNSDNEGIVNIKGPSDGQLLERMIKEYFCSDHFKQDSDYAKILAWRNKTVDEMNRMVRTFIYGPNPPDMMVGEKLIADSPIRGLHNQDVFTYNTNDEFELVQLTNAVKELYGERIACYIAITRSWEAGLMQEHEIHILSSAGRNAYDRVERMLKGKAIALVKDKTKQAFERVQAWVEYYNFLAEFAEVKYNYAITVHKAQGSTYDNCFVMVSDIERNRKISERNRILYTAFTRPRSLLVKNMLPIT